MTTTRSVNWGRVVAQAFAAGFIAGLTLMIYLYATVVAPSHSSVLAWWQSIAAAAFGPEAYSDQAYAWLGLLVHFVASIGWAGGYAYFAQVQKFINVRWLISGIGFGLIVYTIRQALLLAAAAFVFPPTPLTFLNDLLAHMLFFGVPLAFVVARMDRTA
jgi:uncharacterized membrane protein YagU involved in acid resistance